jgi:hypothetical protein
MSSEAFHIFTGDRIEKKDIDNKGGKGKYFRMKKTSVAP